jgi:hypothetical protein
MDLMGREKIPKNTGMGLKKNRVLPILRKTHSTVMQSMVTILFSKTLKIVTFLRAISKH